jgi:hypothetical protein
MPTPIRFRTDSSYYAEVHRDVLAGKPWPDYLEPGEREQIEATPPPEPGDAWRLGWHGSPDKTAGYAICCPKCREIHYWSSASNCASKRQTASGGWTCDHQEARTSCWTWTVDETGKPIKAVASLFVNHKGGCGYHGHLGDGGALPGYLSDG